MSLPKPTKKDRHRFGAKVLVDLETGCHLWAAGRFRDGYGNFATAGRAGV